MKKKGIRALAAALSVLMITQLPGVSGYLSGYSGTAYADTYRQATVNATTLNVRSNPGTGNSIVKKLSYGTAVTVVDEVKDSAGTTWYKIRFTSGSETKEGYASSSYIKFPSTTAQDKNFEQYLNSQGFPESYKESLRTLHAEHPTWIFQAQKTGLDWNQVIENEAAVGANLVGTSSISSWKSTEYGAYDWNKGTWTGFDGASWVAASEEIVCYYMDPRNFLNDTYIFQFLNHNYDSAHQTLDGLKSMVTGTFLEKAMTVTESEGNSGMTNPIGPTGPTSSGNDYSGGPGAPGAPSNNNGSASGNQVQPISPAAAQTESNQNDVSLEGPSATVSARKTEVVALPNVEYGPGMDASAITGDNTGASTTSPVPEGQSYADIIMKAAAQSGVNPYVLGAMILQEQGKGTSGSISGKTSGYEGYYNFFNIGAYQSGSMSAVTRGLWYASQSGNYGRPWNSIEKSIVGGAQYYGENYVKQGQDTFYLKKFNVQGSNLYKHQYMTNIEGAAGEGAKLAKAYTDEMKSQTLVFKIPVYNNMPETACAKPTGSGSPNNKLSTLSVTGYVLTPTFSMDTEKYDIIVNPSVDKIEVKASAIDSKATIEGAGTIGLQNGNNTISVEVKAENGTVRTYKLNVVRQSDAPVVNVTGNGTGGSGTGSVKTGMGSSNGPGAPTSSSDVGTGVGPGASASTASPENTQPTETKADNTVTVVTPQMPGSNQDVEVGARPGNTSSMETSGSSGVVQPAVRPTETTASTTPPTETTAPAKTPESTEASTSAAQTSEAVKAEDPLTKGDCNGDGKVTILDLLLIKKQILGQNVLSGAKLAAADMDGDGKITDADAKALQKKISG